MSLKLTAVNRLEELIRLGEVIKAAAKSYGGQLSANVFSIPQSFVDEDQARQWTMNVLTILRSTFGENSDGYQQAKESLETCADYRTFCIILATIKAALDDLKGGYFFEAKTLLEAEVFCDLLEQARELHRAGYKDASAVLAGGVLEQHMRGMCVRRSISLTKPNGKHKMINDMNDELAKSGAYNAFKRAQITALAALRNNAAHGNVTVYTADDVANFLRDVTGFCAECT